MALADIDDGIRAGLTTADQNELAQLGPKYRRLEMENAIRDAYRDDLEFVDRFLADELERRGLRASENRVHRLCREHRNRSATTRKGRKVSGKRPEPAVHDDLVDRAFTADRLDKVWLTDITEHPTGNGKLCLCTFKSGCSNRIAGYAMSDRLTADLAAIALRAATPRLSPAGTVVVHSDRGSQFRARQYVAVLKANKLSGSMGRAAAGGDAG